MSSAKPVVLVVEDEPFILMAARDGLEASGFTVVEADDAEQALQRLADYPEISGIFTDINMPGACDGMDFAHAARKARGDMAIIVTSGRPMVSRGDMPPRSRFVPKPYLIGEVAKMMSEAIG